LAPVSSLVSVYHLMARTQFEHVWSSVKVIGSGILFICSMVLQCAGTIKSQLQQTLQPLSYKHNYVAINW